MTAASKETYSRPENKLSYWTHRNICLNALKNELGMTFREVANKTRLKPDNCWKRMSELHKDGKIKIIGKKIENGNWNSIYSINTNPDSFSKKISLRDWLKKEHPDILHKYEILIKHEL